MKLTDEQIEDLRYSVLDDSVKIIDYLDKKFDEQEKRNRSNTIFTIINTVLALIAAIAAVISVIPLFL